ncbi:MAG: N-acetylmuramic acid 6-phosphate etherase [Terriglobales bacterium]
MDSDSSLGNLRTEAANAAAAELDCKSALEIARVIHAEDRKVPAAVEPALPQIARAIECIASALRNGGRLIYVGAGTSGRIAALDATECPPTFDTDPKMVQFVMAGGPSALGKAAEIEEDSRGLGQRDMRRKKPSAKDVVVGITASGRTPYTLAALEYARSRGATVIVVTCNTGSPVEKLADILIVVEVGPEVVAGSTRMKAGTAQKLVLNMLSTGAMMRLGYVYGNLMVNLHLQNKKLEERGLSILELAAGVDRPTAQRALRAAGNSVPAALVMLKTGCTRAQAQRRLKAAGGNVRQAIENGKLA